VPLPWEKKDADHADEAARIVDTVLAEPNGGDPDGPAVVRMLDENLAQVPARVLSKAGRALVPGRKAELETYLKDLRRETDELRSL
jgi:hypothetical protein